MPTSRDELKLDMQTARPRFQGQNVCRGVHALLVLKGDPAQSALITDWGVLGTGSKVEEGKGSLSWG